VPSRWVAHRELANQQGPSRHAACRVSACNGGSGSTRTATPAAAAGSTPARWPQARDHRRRDATQPKPSARRARARGELGITQKPACLLGQGLSSQPADPQPTRATGQQAGPGLQIARGAAVVSGACKPQPGRGSNGPFRNHQPPVLKHGHPLAPKPRPGVAEGLNWPRPAHPLTGPSRRRATEPPGGAPGGAHAARPSRQGPARAGQPS